MKSRTVRFTIRFHKDSTHWVSVVVHSTRAVLRCVETKLGSKTTSHADAFCWQADQPANDQCVAEIHLARTHLTVDCIAHESAHAAYIRSLVMGIRLDSERFEEWVATDTGRLTEAIVLELIKRRIKIRNYVPDA